MPDSLGRSNDQRRQEALRILDAASSIRAPGRSPKPRSRQLAGPGCAAALRILAAGCMIRTPGGSPKPRSGRLAGPGCAAALRILAAGRTVRAPGSPPDPRHRQHGQTSWEDLRSSGAGSSPLLGVLQALPDPQRRPRGQRRQRAFRILGTGRTVRAPGRSPDPKSGQLAGPGCAAGPSGSSVPAARSEHQADLRSPGAGSSPALDVLQPSGSSVPAAQSEHQADPRIPRAGSSPALDALQPPGSLTSAKWPRSPRRPHRRSRAVRRSKHPTT